MKDGLEKSLIRSHNKKVARIFEDIESARRSFILGRFRYLKEFCEKQTGEAYTPKLLASVLLDPKMPNPGVDQNPWEDHDRLVGSVEKQLNLLFPSSPTGPMPKLVFVGEFNQYLRAFGVPVLLKTKNNSMFWMPRSE